MKSAHTKVASVLLKKASNIAATIASSVTANLKLLESMRAMRAIAITNSADIIPISPITKV